MFLANSHPATILFDFGAPHLFISSKFAAKYNLPIIIMKYTMIVSSPGGEMKTKHICLAISIAIMEVDFLSNLMSHPGSRKLNRSLHTCAQDVQFTRTANNMVNRYNISLNYKLESLQNDPWVQKKYYRVARKFKRRCVFHRNNWRRGSPSLYLLAPPGTLGWTPMFCST
jgi:hypothetical protein